MTSVSILDMTSTEAKKFFLKSSSYFNVDLPQYINFEKMLEQVDKIISNCPIQLNLDKSFRRSVRQSDVNHVIYICKDTTLSWRPITMVNPILYVILVNIITKNDNWEKIKSVFRKSQECTQITCESIPLETKNYNTSDKGEQILRWWENIELKSLELALDYEYLFETDISSFYPSIYTHSIAWALHGKDEAKQNQNSYSLLGNQIDGMIQNIQKGQTNGIPQGSVLFDCISEIILSYADRILANTLKKIKISDYKILRYRDDYKIFCNNFNDGNEILKILSEILLDLGLSLNSAKTKAYSDIVANSIKKDKVKILQKNIPLKTREYLIALKDHSIDFPNSGSLVKKLSEYYDFLKEQKEINHVDVLISIVVDLIYRNPRVCAVGFAVLSLLIEKSKNSEDVKDNILLRIHNKFKKQVKTGYHEIWQQRLSLTKKPLNEKVCVAVNSVIDNSSTGTESLWSLEFINKHGQLSKNIKENLFEAVKSDNFIDRDKFNKKPKIIQSTEFKLFNLYF